MEVQLLGMWTGEGGQWRHSRSFAVVVGPVWRGNPGSRIPLNREDSAAHVLGLQQLSHSYPEQGDLPHCHHTLG